MFGRLLKELSCHSLATWEIIGPDTNEGKQYRGGYQMQFNL